ncbi:hypothetical protein [Aurantiacibacter sediminis]|uniref:Uncharacterized protein n=1 Tax=Aurantiacibacter sediminis TaxID=2793064 RepID=A0ABS0N276_9SPHN|nr:hypothetical protein [Aurantiacibacter sediminis]MBH5322066.1 hypothetical protein [Aurantiacibacter sediminis]
MKLPKIDVASLPDLDKLTGFFGASEGPGHDDTIIVIATIVYDSNPPFSGLF